MKQQFMWPTCEDRHDVLVADILCKIPRPPVPSGTKSRALFELPDVDAIQDVYDSELKRQ